MTKSPEVIAQLIFLGIEERPRSGDVNFREYYKMLPDKTHVYIKHHHRTIPHQKPFEFNYHVYAYMKKHKIPKPRNIAQMLRIVASYLESKNGNPG